MRRNLRLYPAWQVSQNALFWLPVFFLYFSATLPLEQVLRLEAVYYLAVVILEVPSGYFSDRLGRKPTLILSAVAATCAYALFVVGGSFAVLAGGQILCAAAMAFNSGTDSALLYDSLDALGEGDRYGDLEGEAGAWAFRSLAVAALVGGALSGVDLRIAYGLSGIAAVAALGVAFGFSEPPRRRRAAAVTSQGRHLWRLLQDPTLSWVFAYVVAMTIFNHVPYELIQPWLELLLDRGAVGPYALTPGASGVTMAITMALASVASPRAVKLSRWMGPTPTLMGAMLMQGAIIVAMGLAIHPLILALLLLRSVPGALSRPVALAIIQPRVGGELRATWLSLQSLGSRLAFSACLALASLSVADAIVTQEVLTTILIPFVALLGVVWTALVFTRPRNDPPR